VYEDEQTLCDMDGSKLAFDNHQLPKLQALANPPNTMPPKVFWRGRLVSLAAGLVLATVLGLVYYVPTQRQARPHAVPAAQSRETSAAEEPAKTDPAVNPKATVTPHQPDKVSSEPEAKPPATPKPETATNTTNKKRPANLNTPQPAKPAAAVKKPKKDSKVGAILKKTGRILKKPFKF
jgi:hypothetical protein